MSVTGERQGDVELQNEGSIWIFWARSAGAIAWFEENTDAQAWGKNGFVIEHRYVASIVAALQDEGFTVH